jgi:hypothetical protein
MADPCTCWNTWDCSCLGCCLEADQRLADPDYDAWSDSLDAYDGALPTAEDGADLRADVLRSTRIPRPHRKARQVLTESSPEMGARMGGGR